MLSAIDELSGAQNHTFAVRLADLQVQSLLLQLEGRVVVASVRTFGLNQKVVLHWLKRHEIPLRTGPTDFHGHQPCIPFVRLGTLVVCVDQSMRGSFL
jgi:hypothetical protein